MRLGYLAGVTVVALGLLGGSARAATVSITITNLTSGIYFKELLVAVHDAGNNPFLSGSQATAGLEMLAECGAQATLVTELRKEIARLPSSPSGAGEAADDAEDTEDVEVEITDGEAAKVWGVDDYPALRLLTPGQSVTIGPLTLADAQLPLLSIAGRLMATNDGFAGLEAMAMPTAAGTYTFELLGFDAGTEPNTEVFGATDADCSTLDPDSLMPDLPGVVQGHNGEGVPTLRLDGAVHIHRGILGDNDPNGGLSDLDPSLHRWTNPVGRVELTVNED